MDKWTVDKLPKKNIDSILGAFFQALSSDTLVPTLRYLIYTMEETWENDEVSRF